MKTVHIVVNNGFLFGAHTEIKDPYRWSMVKDVLKVKNKETTLEYQGHTLTIDEKVLISINPPPKTEFILITITDTIGNIWKEVVSDLGDTVQVYGLHTDAYFESEAYHLTYWAKENEFTYKSEKVFL